MEQEAQNLLATLKRSSVAVDAKVAAFNAIKSNIKHLRVPDSAQPTIFECIRVAITTTQSPALSATAFSTLGHLIKRLSLQQQNNIIVAQSKKLLPVLLEKLGDTRESHRNAASQNLADFYPFAQEQVETIIKDGALSGHSPRAKETAMMWVLQMHQAEGMQFKGYVPQLVACLEDADGMVRETAKSCIVELFKDAPDRAKTDLKKRMKIQEVRSTIVSQVVSQLDMRPGEHIADLGASTISVQTMPDFSRSEAGFGDSVMSDHPPSQDIVPVDPLYVSTSRELEDMFQEMRTLFEGKETEFNWGPREKATTKLRRLLKGNSPTDFHSAFIAGIRSLMDGVTRISNSLRTTVSTNGCQLTQELARSLGPALDPVVEMCIQNFIKMSANTKKIASENGDATVQVLLSYVSYNKRLMEHIWFSYQEKNVQTRTYAAGWLRTLIRKHASHKSQIEHSGGLELVEKCIKKGLGDANPKVREGTRAAYWSFAMVWPEHAAKIMDSLDPKSKGQLEKDPHNPNAGSLASSVSSVSSTSKFRPAASVRPSVRDTINAQRKALAARGMPDRPTSAMSHFSPTKRTPSGTLSSRTTAIRTGAARPPSAMARDVSNGSQVSTGASLLAAPVRRARRPEIPRPQTADPYAASRRAATQSGTPGHSPNTSPQKSSARNVVKGAVRTPSRAMAPTAASTLRTKSRAEIQVPKKTPRRSTVGAVDSPASSPSRGDDLTLVVPFTKPPDSDDAFAAPHPRQHKHSAQEGELTMDDGEGFTMVFPRGFDQRRSFNERPTKIPTPRTTPQRAAPPSASAGKDMQVQTPSGQSPARLKSPLPQHVAHVDDEPVQVYEDPVTEESAAHAGASELDKPVLEELPIDRTNERKPSGESTANTLTQSTRSNEQNIDEERTLQLGKTTSNGTVTTTNGSVDPETMRSRRLLASGVERIHARTLDAHGFRRLQELVKCGRDVWGDQDENYGQLLVALLEYLEAPDDTLKATGSGPTTTKAQSLKGQVLATIRAMLSLHRRQAVPFYPRVLCSVLISRRQWDESMHITIDLEKTAAEIVRDCDVLQTVDAVLVLLENLSNAPTSPSASSCSSERLNSPIPSPDEQSAHRTSSFALVVLGSLISAAAEKNNLIDAKLTQRLGDCAVKYLQDPDSDVRKADLDFCLVLHEKLGREDDGKVFWSALRKAGLKEGSANLITYYIAKSRRALA